MKCLIYIKKCQFYSEKSVNLAGGMTGVFTL